MQSRGSAENWSLRALASSLLPPTQHVLAEAHSAQELKFTTGGKEMTEDIMSISYPVQGTLCLRKAQAE
jgi:hypothetical protein